MGLKSRYYMENNILSLLDKNQRTLLNVAHFAKNETIFKEGDECKEISILIDGKVQIVSYSFSGKEVVFNTLVKNQIFGNNLLFSSDPTYKGDVISLSKSTVVFIKKENLIYLLSSNQEFLEEYLRIQSDFGKSLNSKIKLFSIDSALERFKYYLFINKNEIEYKSITSLANELNLKRETLSRLISRLEKENVIQRSLHHINLN